MNTFFLRILESNLIDYILNKLGQRQSQTPYSSAFWVQKNFKSKKFWVQKNFGPQKYSVSKKNLGFKKILGQKQILGLKHILGLK